MLDSYLSTNASVALTNETVMSVYGGLLKRSCNLSDSAPCPEGYEYDGAFNNVPLALATLVEVSSLEGWDVVMWRTVDDAAIEAVNNTNISASEALQDPIGMQAYGHVFFFLSFIFICSFFILQLFIGVFTVSNAVMLHRISSNDFNRNHSKSVPGLVF